MERNYKILLGVALVISVILLIVDIYIGGIAFIIFIVLLMSVFIMGDAKMLPNVTASLNNEATDCRVQKRRKCHRIHHSCSDNSP